MHETMNESTIHQVIGFSENLEKVGHATLRDISFRQSYGRPLAEALDWIGKKNYSKTTLIFAVA